MCVRRPSSYNDDMTTITTPTIPTATISSTGIRRLVSVFLAGAVLAGTAAAGITAALIDDTPARAASTPPKVVYVTSASAVPCPRRPGPC